MHLHQTYRKTWNLPSFLGVRIVDEESRAYYHSYYYYYTHFRGVEMEARRSYKSPAKNPLTSK